jgi:hypothetical protein
MHDSTFEILLSDGRTESRWSSDSGTLDASRSQHLVVGVDGGSKVITFVVDGTLNDGGDARQFGWGRFNPNLKTVNGAPKLKIAKSVERLRIYTRYLRTSEAIAAYLSGPR